MHDSWIRDPAMKTFIQHCVIVFIVLFVAPGRVAIAANHSMSRAGESAGTMVQTPTHHLGDAWLGEGSNSTTLATDEGLLSAGILVFLGIYSLAVVAQVFPVLRRDPTSGMAWFLLMPVTVFLIHFEFLRRQPEAEASWQEGFVLISAAGLSLIAMMLGSKRRRGLACQRDVLASVDGEDCITKEFQPDQSSINLLRQFNRKLDYQANALNQHAIVAVTDPMGRITYANELFCRISGYSLTELIGSDHRLINSGHHPRQFFTEMYLTIRAGKIWRGEICNRAKNGETYWVKTTIVPDVNESGEIMRFVAIRDDITELKSTQQSLEGLVEQLKNQQEELDKRNRELEDYASNVSYDLESPLLAILGCASALEEQVLRGDTRKAVDDVRSIQRAVGMLRDRVEALQELGRAGRRVRDVAEVRVAEVLDQVIESMGLHQESARVSVERNLAAATVSAQRDRLVQVMRSLLENAVTHGLRNDGARILVETSRKGQEVWVTVHDNGPGVPLESRTIIFEEFHRPRQAGIGSRLGLALVRKIAFAHGGRAWVEESPLGGAAFRIAFPIVAKQDKLHETAQAA